MLHTDWCEEEMSKGMFMAIQQQSRLKILRRLLSTKKINNHLLQDLTLWEKLGFEEREELALAFIEKGESMLQQKSPQAYTCFCQAEYLAFFSKEVWRKEGLAWLQFARRKCNEKALIQAKNKFEQAANRDRASFEELIQLAKVCQNLASSSWSSQRFAEAELWVQRARSLAGGNKKKLKEVYSIWGAVWRESYLASGEPCDLSTALNCYKKVFDLGCRQVSFILGYLQCLVDMHNLCGDLAYLQEGWVILKELIEKKEKLEPELLLKAITLLSRLHHLTGEESFFHHAEQLANRSLEKNKKLLLAEAKLFLRAGQDKLDPKRVYQAIKRLASARMEHTDCWVFASYYAEAVAFLGFYTDQLPLLKDAHEAALEAVEKGPEEAYAWYALGVVLMRMASYFEEEGYAVEAQKKLQRALKINPQLSCAWKALGDIFFLQASEGVSEEAVTCTQEALQCSPKDPHLYNHLGWLLLRRSEYTASKEDVICAIHQFEQAIDLRGGVRGSPETSWLYNYGCALDFMGDFSESRDYYDKAIDVLSYTLFLEPEDQAVRYNLALTWTHLGELLGDEAYFLQAVGLYAELVKQDPEDELSMQDWGVALLNLASLAEMQSDSKSQALFAEAEEKLRKAVQLGNDQGYYHLACLYSLQGSLDQSVDYLYKAYYKNELPPVKDLLADDWLERLQVLPSFRALIGHLEQQENE